MPSCVEAVEWKNCLNRKKSRNEWPTTSWMFSLLCSISFILNLYLINVKWNGILILVSCYIVWFISSTILFSKLQNLNNVTKNYFDKINTYYNLNSNVWFLFYISKQSFNWTSPIASRVEKLCHWKSPIKTFTNILPSLF